MHHNIIYLTDYKDIQLFMPTYDNLRTPAEIYKIVLQPQQIMCTLNGKPKRLIFHLNDYSEKQIEQINKFRSYAFQELKSFPCDDATILRYLYSKQFVFQQTLKDLKVFNEWHHNARIQQETSSAREIIDNGFIYTYGRDKQYRPIIFLDLSLIDLNMYFTEDYYCAINQVLSVVIQSIFVPGIIEKYLFVIDMGNKAFTSLPFDAVLDIIQKLGIVYSMRMGRMLIINVNTVIKLTYYTVKTFLAEDTISKITLLSSQEVQNKQFLKYVHEEQLQHKYGGTLNNLLHHWPPRVPGVQFVQNQQYIQEQLSQYYSAILNQSFFKEHEIEDSCCSQSCSIY